jgi:hypothetical protein
LPGEALALLVRQGEAGQTRNVIDDAAVNHNMIVRASTPRRQTRQQYAQVRFRPRGEVGRATTPIGTPPDDARS